MTVRTSFDMMEDSELLDEFLEDVHGIKMDDVPKDQFVLWHPNDFAEYREKHGGY